MNETDRDIRRELSRRHLDNCHSDEQDVRRELWRKHNSLKGERPLIFARRFAYSEMPESALHCEDPLARRVENFFRRELFRHTIRDDSVFEPWINVRASFKCSGWGVKIKRKYPDEPRGAYKVDYPIKELGDIKQLRMPWHEIDEDATSRNASLVEDVIGDIYY